MHLLFTPLFGRERLTLHSFYLLTFMLAHYLITAIVFLL